MEGKIFSFLLFITINVFSQVAFYNFGNIQMHSNTKIGFHTNLINDGTFDNNKGLAGFYSDNETRIVSGNNRAIFFDIEIDAINDLELKTSLGLTNELSFINGKVSTPRSNLGVSFDFIKHDFYAGEDDNRHVDGYTSVIGLNEFTFPIGDDDRLRPMILPTQNNESTFLGAYFFEDPNTPSTFFQNFLTDQKQVFIENISKIEFWDLNGTNQTTVTLTWDALSEISLITNTLDKLRVVGWSNAEKKWMDLGNTNLTGDFTQGQITSDKFIPNNFEIITIGAGFSDENLTGTNIIFTPNGDNVNDSLVFESLENYTKNYLEIFNRWGNTVYKSSNYKNDWNGKSEGRSTINKNDDLPIGTYFYVLKFGRNELSKIQKGWIYINR